MTERTVKGVKVSKVAGWFGLIIGVVSVLIFLTLVLYGRDDGIQLSVMYALCGVVIILIRNPISVFIWGAHDESERKRRKKK